jgi:MFS family permease
VSSTPHSPDQAAATAAIIRTAPERGQFLALFTAVMLPMFLAAVDQTLLATATPRIAAELGNLSDTSWVAVAYLLAATVMAPVYGRLGDRLGRRQALIGALVVFALGSSACGLAGSMGTLVSARALQGLGGGGLMVLSQALIGELVAPIDRPRYQGYFAIVFTASSVGGPVLGGLVVHHADWRWLFWANLPLCLLAAWRVSRLQRGAPPALRGAPVDPWGLVLFAVSACASLSWLSLAGHRFHWVSWSSMALLLVAIGGMVALLRQQARHPSPLLPLDLLRLPGVPAICAMVIVFAASMFALVFLLPIQLQLGHGESAAGAGWQMLPLTGGLVLGSTINSRITSRTAMPTRTPPFGLAAAALMLVVLAFAPSNLWVIDGAALVIGLGFGTVMPAAQLSVQVMAGRARLGAAAASLSLTRSTGASVGTAAFGGLVFTLLKLHPGLAEGESLRLDGVTPERIEHAFHVVYATLAVFVGLGAWIATRVPATRLAHWDEPSGEMAD